MIIIIRLSRIGRPSSGWTGRWASRKGTLCYIAVIAIIMKLIAMMIILLIVININIEKRHELFDILFL